MKNNLHHQLSKSYDSFPLPTADCRLPDLEVSKVDNPINRLKTILIKHPLRANYLIKIYFISEIFFLTRAVF
jgi:hypothetical protein